MTCLVRTLWKWTALKSTVHKGSSYVQQEQMRKARTSVQDPDVSDVDCSCVIRCSGSDGVMLRRHFDQDCTGQGDGTREKVWV